MSALTGDIRIRDGGVVIAKSNAFEFTRTDNQSGTEQTHENRLLAQMTIPNINSNFSFFQKFSNSSNGGSGDNLTTQIGTIHTIDSFKVYSFDDDSLVDTITVPAASYLFDDLTYGTVSFYDFEIDISGYGGYYYVIATINTTQIYQSEPFYVSDFDESKGNVLSWHNDSNSDYNDGIDYTASPVNLMRVDSRFFNFSPGSVNTYYTGFNRRKELLKGQPLEFCTLELKGMPYWMIRKINIATLHDYFLINGEQWVLEEDSPEWIRNSYIYTNSIKLQKYDFEDYDELETEEAETTSRLEHKSGGFIKYKDSGGYITHK